MNEKPALTTRGLTMWKKIPFIFVIICGIAAAPLQAAEDEPIHPLMKDRFNASLGAFLADKELKISLNGQDANDLIDFGERWGFDSTENSFAGEFRWRFGEKWSVSGQYFSSKDEGTAVLEEDVAWGDYVFREGTFAGAGFDMTVARLFAGRRFSTGPRHEFGLGLGAHWIELGAFIEGEVRVNDASTGVRRESVSTGAPLPNLGAWYYYAFSPKWLARARLDYLDVSFEEYSGGLTNVSVGIEYQMLEHLGVSMSYQYFGLDVDVTATTWKGEVDVRLQGPFLSLTANW
jgi:hypothetical protein